MKEFDPKNDKIAVVVKEFTLKKKSEIFLDRFSEPYIVSMAIDEGGANNPSIDFNILPFPNVRKGEKISFDGQGHLIYGSDNPGEFLAYSILFMESDKDVRDFGKLVEEIMTSEAVTMGAKALLTAAPTYSTAITVLQKLTELMAKQLQKNKDDELFRRNGTLLRDVTPAYDILRTYESENDFINTKTAIIPLSSSNMLGNQTRKVEL
ncbi:hypothetical protein [Candidatus Venteria ishoeyi]|uniref:Uncharacterized protein n=1 Tax=Candidatus Venteria ishoeyi TaxID=1899563 RepID=A0A1H6F7U7_9GAMM|nr:hypothetical protein [Candidatus Venteria ishoeyi]SEH05035.1 Uncharacterised protein [Candidatus Venteria ishoeyi]